ncbi:uncharacterized protein LOC143904779 [Temnothorax americanus]|uniref:uncharacterized protein LOC143904779 n=1 Tax=Temnothorax americanus TaxID=1964332 RepID=UPI004067CDA3
MHNKYNMTKVEWICIVPDCKSNSRVPGHFFSKNVTLSDKWREAINNNIISNTSSEELRKYRVCHLHFLPDDYIYTQNRPRLKHNAVPSVNIYNSIETNTVETHDTNITEPHSHFETSVSDLLNEQCGTSTQTNTQTDNELQSKISSYTNEISTSNTEYVETNESQNIPNDSINEVIDRPSTPKTSRSILASITRQSQLTPKARKIYRRAVMLAKERNQMKAQVVRYKQRLKDAKKFADAQFCKKFNTLTPTQRLFFNMQLKNVKYSPKVNYKKLFNELKSSLQSTCPKRSSIYLKNICFKLQ